MTAYTEHLPAHECWANARRMTELHPELRYVEGWLIEIDDRNSSWRRQTAHAWNETPDGQVVDATAHNFGPSFTYRYEEASLDQARLEPDPECCPACGAKVACPCGWTP